MTIVSSTNLMTEVVLVGGEQEDAKHIALRDSSYHHERNQLYGK